VSVEAEAGRQLFNGQLLERKGNFVRVLVLDKWVFAQPRLRIDQINRLERVHRTLNCAASRELKTPAHQLVYLDLEIGVGLKGTCVAEESRA
jgi:hypothetical protein